MHKYKLGDKYRSDFDHQGLINKASKASISWGYDKLYKLHTSLEDLNYHTESKSLWEALISLKEGKNEEAEKHLIKFHKVLKEENMDNNDIKDVFKEFSVKYSKSVKEYGITEAFIDQYGEFHMTSNYEIPHELYMNWEKEFSTEKMSKGANVKGVKKYYLAWSSWFDGHKYDVKKISEALNSIGATDVHLENEGGKSNQPEVVVFNYKGTKEEPLRVIGEALETEWIYVYPVDWRVTKQGVYRVVDPEKLVPIEKNKLYVVEISQKHRLRNKGNGVDICIVKANGISSGARFEGTVVYSESDSCTVGEFDHKWSREDFKPYEGDKKFENGGGLELSNKEKLQKLGIKLSSEFGDKYRSLLNKINKQNNNGEYVGYQLNVNKNQLIVIGKKGTVEFEITNYDKIEDKKSLNGIVAKSVYYKKGGNTPEGFVYSIGGL